MVKKWNELEIEILKKEYPFIETKTIACKLNKTCKQCAYKAYNLKLKKDISFLRLQALRLKEGGKLYHFKKGQISHNKGKKWAEYMPEKSAEKIRKSQFIKGQIPHNSLSLGTEVIRKDKSGKEYLLIKAHGEKKLVFKQIYIYEQSFGKVAKGKCVVFKDGNSLNCVIDNLECITRAELVIINSIHNYPPELKQQIKKVNKLKKIIKKLEK